MCPLTVEMKPLGSKVFSQPTIFTLTPGRVSLKRWSCASNLQLLCSHPFSLRKKNPAVKELREGVKSLAVHEPPYIKSILIMSYLTCFHAWFCWALFLTSVAEKSLNAFILSGMPTGCSPLTRDNLFSLQESQVQPSRRLKTNSL